jgi:hypothetical protein
VPVLTLKVGLITHEVFAEVPPRVEYAITPLGTEMLDNVAPLWLWVARACIGFRTPALLSMGAPREFCMATIEAMSHMFVLWVCPPLKGHPPQAKPYQIFLWIVF